MSAAAPSVVMPTEIVMRSVEELLPYAANSRKHSPAQIDILAATIKRVGWTNPLLIADGGILAGHGRVMAAKKLGLSRVPCIDLSYLPEMERRALVINDNRLAEFGSSWDLEALKAETDVLREAGLDVEELTAFSENELTDLFDGMVEPPKTNGNPDDAPPVPETPVSVLGDVWCIGDHRVMCGSSLEPAAWNVLMGQDEADVVFTDPPYGVSVGDKNDSIAKAQGRKNKTGGILNDDLQGDDLYKFLLAMFQCVSDRMKPGASIYVYHADSEGIAFRTAFRDAGFKIRGCLIWKKNTFSMGRSDHQWIHEPALFGWREGAAHTWLGGRKQSTFFDLGEDSPFRQLPDGRWQITVGEQVFTVSGDATVEAAPGSLFLEPKPAKSALHPTMKPVNLVARHLKNSARRGDVVLDAFGGSGSTAVAAHQLGMKSRLMELDPKYVDVICLRLSAFTGLPITHAVTGELFPRNGGQRVAPSAEPQANDGSDVF